jgi:predicted ATPase
MEGKLFIKHLYLQHLLSYGTSHPQFTLEPLNVLIGANASGKSNLIEAISILQAAPYDLLDPIRTGGGVGDWLWKGTKNPTAVLDATIDYPDGRQPLRYSLSFTQSGQRLELIDERIENATSDQGAKEPYFYYRYQSGRPTLNIRTSPDAPAGNSQGRSQRKLRREDLLPDQSVLSQRRDPDQYPELTYLASKFSAIKLYREWDLGRYTSPRLPQKADQIEDFLLEDASNLSLVINNLSHYNDMNRQLREHMQRFYEPIEEVTTKISGGTVQLFIREKGMNEQIPATRLSDGTLRYLCLLAILLHPNPPSLVCIEEPELGLHPDILPTLAELLVNASQRMQIIVTTHSDILVSALSDTPEAIIVCERTNEGSQLRRLEREQMKTWIEKYSLGELWRMGELGGTRW